jgi:hypothetical protein
MAELEPIIEKGLSGFVEVGNALLEISDRRLYRATHSTFQDYVSAKWKMTARRAYQLCEAAEIVRALPENVNHGSHLNERQVRELAKVAPANRAEVLARAQDQADAEQRPLTTKDVERAAQSEPKYTCDSCGETFETLDEAESLYECQDCGHFTPSTSDYGNHKCSCGKFASKVSDHGCPTCGEGELKPDEPKPTGTIAKVVNQTERSPADIVAPFFRAERLIDSDSNLLQLKYFWGRACKKARAEFLEYATGGHSRP